MTYLRCWIARGSAVQHGVRQVVLGVILALLVTTNVFAADPSGGHFKGSGDPGQGLAAESVLSGKQPAASGLTTTAVTSNPYGCYGRSDQPHASVHVPGTVDALGWTICSYTLPYEYVSSTFYRQDCLLFICWWTQVDHKSSSTVSWGQVSVTVAHTCANSDAHLYEIVSHHEARGPDGILITADTGDISPAALSCG
jgi:hypothetical protein